MSRGQRLAWLAVAAAIAVAAVIVLRPGSEESDPTRGSRPADRGGPAGESNRGSGRGKRPGPPSEGGYATIRFEDGKPVGGARDITVDSGETVRLAVRSDRAEQVHIHGYDRVVDIQPGRTKRVSFPARLEGVFEIEAHSDGTLLANLRVEP